MRTIWTVTNRGHRHGGFAAVALLAAVFAVPSVGRGVTGAKAAGAEKQGATERSSTKATKKPATKPKKDESDTTDEKPVVVPPPVEHETVKLADGTEVQVEKWGETFLGYDYEPPLAFGNHRLREIVEYERLGHHNVPIMAIQVDPKHRRIYWCDGNSFHPVGHVFSANLDGGNVQLLASDRAHPRNLVFDEEGGKLFWIEGMSKSGAVMTADTNGRNLKTLVDRLNTPYGLAVDSQRSELYYYEQHRIVRVKTDGSGETMIVDGTQNVGPNASALAFDPIEDKLYWAVVQGHIRRAGRDGSSPEHAMLVSPWGEIQGFALDTENRKIYFLNSPYGRVERANLDGSQREVLAVFPVEDSAGFTRGVSGGITVDAVHKQLYYSGGKGKGTSDSPRIIRMNLPPVLKATTRRSPPLVTAISPVEQRTGGEISLLGENFTHTTDVSFIDDSTCKHVAAKFHIVDDRTLTITVPRLSGDSKHPVIVVQTPSGVTMTLRRVIQAIHPKKKYKHDRFAAGALAQLWLMPDSHAANVEMALVYLENGSQFAADGKGTDTVFAKNGSSIRLSLLADSVVYHEPFAFTTRTPEMSLSSKTEAGLRFVPVPAIRPSFVEALLTYNHEAKKGNKE